MLLKVHHTTRYSYDAPVRTLVQSHRMMPSVFEGQKVLNWEVSVTSGQKGGGFRDGAGDWIQAWTVIGPVSEVEVVVQGLVETVDLAGVLRGHRETVCPDVYLRETHLTYADDKVQALAAGVDHGSGPLSLAHALSHRVAEAITYRPGATDAATSASEAVERGEGVCQDHAHVLIALAKALGMPARYVSGYLLADSDGVAHEAAHAWAEVYVKDLGWVGFDPANECCPDDRYIRVGSGFDAQDAAPIRGIARGPGEESLVVTVKVEESAQTQAQSQQ